MYATLQERFRGALQGCAIADAQSLDPLHPILVDQGRKITGLYNKLSAPAPTEHERLAHAILLSVLRHEHPTERQRALDAQSPGVLLLSEAIAAQLQGQKPDFQRDLTFQATLNATIEQQLPLQTAITALMELPESSPLDQAIALALYCWSCQPQQFTICTGRSRQVGRYLPNGHPGCSIVPALTGLLCGIACGSGALAAEILPLVKTLPLTDIYGAADHLYCLWAGIRPDAIASDVLQQTVIAQPGQLKPRTSRNLDLNGDYS